MDDTMTILKNKLVATLDFFPSSAPIVFFDIPVYLNVGDLLIHRGTEELLATYNRYIEYRFSTHDYKRFLHLIRPDHVLLFQGGGNLGDMWQDHEELRQTVLQRFPNNACIIFPQTIHFKNEDNMKKAAAIYGACKNFMLFVRDEQSYKIATEQWGVRAQRVPDAAHFLWHTPDFKPHENAPGTLTFSRRDAEASGTIHPAGIDWDDILTPYHVTIYKLLNLCFRVTPFIALQKILIKIWHAHRNLIIRHCIAVFRKHDTVITDRLHGMILATLLGHAVTMNDNSYGKLSSYAHMWLGNLVRKGSEP